MNLALRYRPKTFDDVVGQKAISTILKAMVSKDMLASVLLFTGPSGTGKTSMARIIAAALNSDASEDVHDGKHPAVLEIDAASQGSVDRIRQLKIDLSYQIPGHRVIILDEAHAISEEGKAALLNILEFPPSNVTFILLTTEAQRIPKEVRHRCDEYRFQFASVTSLVERLNYVINAEGMQVSDELVNFVAQQSEGSFREALMLLQQLYVGDITSMQQYLELHGDNDFSITLLNSCLEGPAQALDALEKVLYLAHPADVFDKTAKTVKELLLVKAKLPLTYQESSLERRISLASKIPQANLVKVMRILWDMQTRLTSTDPVRNLEMAFTLIGEVLKVVEDIPANETLSLDKLRTYKFS